MRQTKMLFCAAMLACISTGCTHTQLRLNTVRQSETLTDIYEQQVLDNLAMFVREPGALPFFAFPNQGGADVTDSVGADGSLGFIRDGFATAGIGGSAGRGMSESWTLTPVYDPRRLELMRCAYQQVLVNTGRGVAEGYCPDCDRLQRQFYTGSVTGKSVEDFTRESGRTTPVCFGTCRWFACGSKPPSKKDPCCKIGEYCGTYVWLLPGGQAELSKLTMVILDYAFNDSATAPPSGIVDPIEQTTLYLTADGAPTTKDKASRVVQTTVTLKPAVEVRYNGAEMRAAPAPVLPPMAPANTNILSPRGLQLQQRYLAPQ